MKYKKMLMSLALELERRLGDIVRERRYLAREVESMLESERRRGRRRRR